MTLALVLVATSTALAIAVVVLYNRLVRLRNKNEEAWAGIDVQLQRRADLVPNLVETVRGYQVHEQETLREVTEARAAILRAGGPDEAGRADDRLEGALRRLFAVAEDYPDLKASANFLALQRELAAIEEEISFARRYYNATAEDLTTAVQSFPSVLVARPFGFREAEYFKAAPGDRVAPAVRFGGGE